MSDYKYEDHGPDALGFAELMTASHGSRIRYATDINRFYKYDGKVWRQCNAQNVGIPEIIHKASRHLARERDRICPVKPDDTHPYYIRWIVLDAFARLGGSAQGTASVITQLKDQPSVQCVLNDFAHNPDLLNFRNGTLHLTLPRTITDDGGYEIEEANFRKHDPADMLATMLERDYPEFSSPVTPKWDALLMHMCDGDESFALNLEQALAYGLYGANPEQFMVFLIGDSNIGKTQVLEIVTELAGSLGGHGKIELIRKVSGQEHDSVRADLRGKRFVMLGESSHRLKLDDVKFKDLTGSQVLPTRKLGQEPVDTRVTWTMYAATNELPEVPGDMDDAILRRLWVFQLPGKQVTERDTRLAQKIIADEGEAILYKMAQHLCDWFGNGNEIEQHDKCQMARLTYQQSSDTVAEFCEAMMRPGEGFVSYDDVHKAYVTFCRDRGLSQVSRRALPKRVEAVAGCERDSAHCRFRNVSLIFEAPSWI